MNIRFLFWSILGVLLLNACKKDVVDYSKREIGFSYVNQSLNYTFLYQVQEIIYDDFFNTIDTFNYQILERNDTVFYDNLNQTVLRIERYKRNKDSSLWHYHETVSSRIDQYKYERNENNTKKVKLSFPITFETKHDKKQQINMKFVFMCGWTICFVLFCFNQIACLVKNCFVKWFSH